MTIADRYTYCVAWSDSDRQYVGACAEFPSMSHLDDSMADALTGIVGLVEATVEDMIESGEAPPAPLIDVPPS